MAAAYLFAALLSVLSLTDVAGLACHMRRVLCVPAAVQSHDAALPSGVRGSPLLSSLGSLLTVLPLLCLVVCVVAQPTEAEKKDAVAYAGRVQVRCSSSLSSQSVVNRKLRFDVLAHTCVCVCGSVWWRRRSMCRPRLWICTIRRSSRKLPSNIAQLHSAAPVRFALSSRLADDGRGGMHSFHREFNTDAHRKKLQDHELCMRFVLLCSSQVAGCTAVL